MIVNHVKSSYFALACYLVVTFCACRKTQADSINQTNEVSTAVKHETSDITGTTYSDSMIAILTKTNEDQFSRNDSEALTLLDCNAPVLQDDYLFNTDSINKYEDLVALTSTSPFAEVGGYGCIGQINDNGNFRTCVVFSKMLEAHYSSSLDLIVYQNDTFKENQFKLAQYYANENYERRIESILKSKSTIVRTIFETSKINSTNNHQEQSKIEKMKTIEWYKINANGEVELLSSEMVVFD